MSISGIWRRSMPLVDALTCITGVAFFAWAMLSVESTTGERSLQKVIDPSLIASVSYGLAAIAYRSTKISKFISVSWLWVCGIGSVFYTLVWAFWASLINPDFWLSRPGLILFFLVSFFTLTVIFTLIARCFLVPLLVIFNRDQAPV